MCWVLPARHREVMTGNNIWIFPSNNAKTQYHDTTSCLDAINSFRQNQWTSHRWSMCVGNFSLSSPLWWLASWSEAWENIILWRRLQQDGAFLLDHPTLWDLHPQHRPTDPLLTWYMQQLQSACFSLHYWNEDIVDITAHQCYRTEQRRKQSKSKSKMKSSSVTAGSALRS